MIWSKVPGTEDQHSSDKLVDRFFFYCHLPFLIIISHVIVYGIRGLEDVRAEDRCQDSFWSGVNTIFDQWNAAYDGSNAFVPGHSHDAADINR